MAEIKPQDLTANLDFEISAGAITVDFGDNESKGTKDHRKLFNRDKPKQHPASAITYGKDGETVEEAITRKQDLLIAGKNIKIIENIISAEGGVDSADEISYHNPDYPTVQDALDKLLYVAPVINSFSGGGNYEIGSTITSVNLQWNLNKTVKTQTLNQGIGSINPDLRSYKHDNLNIKSYTRYTLTVNDGTTSVSRNTDINFMPKRYWGVSPKESLNNADILALSSELSTSRNQTRTFNCSGGKYFYLVIKTSYCNGIQFKVGGLSFSALTVETLQLTNASGYVDSYNVYRPNDIQTGSAILVEVS